MEAALLFYFVEEENYWVNVKKQISFENTICSPELGDTLILL
jgi:hypothetical protein